MSGRSAECASTYWTCAKFSAPVPIRSRPKQIDGRAAKENKISCTLFMSKYIKADTQFLLLQVESKLNLVANEFPALKKYWQQT